MGSLSGKIASNGLTPTYVNSATNASPGKLYQCDTSSAAFTVTLPTGSSGSVLRFVDDKGTWATNNLTIAPAATQTIQGISGNGSLVCDLSGAYVEMTWDATSSQWCVQTTGFQYGPPASTTQAGTASFESVGSFSSTCGGPYVNAAITVAYSRVGKNVSLRFQSRRAAGSSSTNPITFDLTNMPATLRPAADITFASVNVTDAGSDQANPGVITIPASGNATLNKSGATGSFTSTASTVGFYAFSVSYTVQ